MKVSVKQNEFTPVTVEFTFETQDELDRFGSLMNYAPVGRILMESSLYETFEGIADIRKYIATLSNTF